MTEGMNRLQKHSQEGELQSFLWWHPHDGHTMTGLEQEQLLWLNIIHKHFGLWLLFETIHIGSGVTPNHIESCFLHSPNTLCRLMSLFCFPILPRKKSVLSPMVQTMFQSLMNRNILKLCHHAGTCGTSHRPVCSAKANALQSCHVIFPCHAALESRWTYKRVRSTGE